MMTIEQHSEYIDDMFMMLLKIERLHGEHSPQHSAMASIYSKELLTYLERLNNESN